ncbi:MAG: stage II sporulation protein R [Clostridium sp.]
MMLCTITGFAGQCETISDRVLRVHVLANSDSQEDQALKLKVRDKVLECSAYMLDDAQDLNQAEALTEQNLQDIQKVAQEEVYRQGYDYPVKVELTNMHFNTRVYETVTLPAGEYDALRVSIGEAQGHNWWCVMFPPMCLPAAEESKELQDVLDPAQMEIVEGGSQYEVKFKTIEVLEDIKSWFGQ